ncbi:Fic family protein [Flavobacterium gawalongense]|uniref:Fic family protein n=1 Tax=Flavobacterium gawalongense TaxID=2594432 RepID=A0A553BTP7_9FLAO|nr:Fic family protein [Flavobacterium gawalongense]TRX02218.1 Fic family protein [Flavobacterium gawalongense]TRX07447.1 Fic family protein [Flavobacterium gawalongense]TRX11615.1 Fic family protein [Flavobacterium gawalongense]TRX12382.1 Fic family protein [Flavobacterium gawalongense]TRX30352.1 Fic family protein [Flavobacterium gawalongense]
MENSRKALELKKQLDDLRPIDKEQEGRIMQKFRLDWNYHSNHLEGNSLTYGETKALILFGVTAQGKPLQDHFEITGHNEAINWVIDVVKGDYPLNENFIRELHTLLLKGPYEVDAITSDGKPTKKRINVGRYKTSPNHVKTKTGEIFYFATPEETPSKMTDLINWYREKSEQKDVNPIFLAAEFHYKFIRIHPFDDGNGRTARILMNFILMKFDYPPVIIKTEDKANYFAALQLADAGNIEAFIEYVSQNLVRSLEIMIAGAKGESIEEEDDLDKEIALLEQRLVSFGKKKVKKTKEVTFDLYNNSILPFIIKYIEKMSKFEKLYYENDFSIIFNGTKKYENAENFLKDFDVLSYDRIIDEIIINYTFSKLKQIGFEDVKYGSYIVIKFDINLCFVYLKYDEPFVEIDYATKLTKIEIEKIVESEVKRHKKFIEKKIAENETKS